MASVARKRTYTNIFIFDIHCGSFGPAKEACLICLENVSLWLVWLGSVHKQIY